MKIFKTWKKATYFEGVFELREGNKNWATPINFPTVFVAYGKGVENGNWKSCTAINTPKYVIDNYFDGIGNDTHDDMYILWTLCKDLEKITWSDVNENKEKIIAIIDSANKELFKLKEL